MNNGTCGITNSLLNITTYVGLIYFFMVIIAVICILDKVSKWYFRNKYLKIKDKKSSENDISGLNPMELC
jgi:hypothetical protein